MGYRPEDLAATLVLRARRRREADRARLRRAREGAREVLLACLDDGSVERAWIIGSAAWGDVHGRSDIDVVVQGMKGRPGALWDRLSQASGLDVDLLRLEELDPAFRNRVLEEGVEIGGFGGS